MSRFDLAGLAGCHEKTVKNAEDGKDIEGANFNSLKTAIETEWKRESETPRPPLVWPSWTLSAHWEQYFRDAPQARDALSQYLEKYAQRYGKIKLLGMSEPMLLKEVYTDAQMVDSRFLRKWKSLDSMEKAYRESNRRDFLPKDSSSKAGYALANTIQFLNILGQPGAGKTTFLRRIGLDALLPPAEKRYNHDSIPVYVELKNLKDQHVHLSEMLKRELVSFNFPADFAEVALRNGKLLVLLDGLDEVPGNNLDHVIEDIREFIDKNSSNRFITSCRTKFYQTWFAQFNDVVLSEFDNFQIQTFLANWFRSAQDVERDSAGKFWTMLSRPENIATLELARRPLLLAFICLFCDETLSLPANRSDLYEEALRILLVRWAAEKRIRKEPVWRGLTTRWETNLLEQIAGQAFKNNKLFFYKKALVSEIDHFLNDNLNAPNLDGNEILDEIEVEQGLFIARTQNVYSFSHLTLQEYLAAKYFYNNGAIKDLAKEYLFELRWREVFLLLVGIGQADNALQQMAYVMTETVKENDMLSSLLTWVAKSFESKRFNGDTDERMVARRAIVIFIVRAIENKGNLNDKIGSHLQKIEDFAFDIDSRLKFNGSGLSDAYFLGKAKKRISRVSVLDAISNIKKNHIFRDRLIVAAENNIKSYKGKTSNNRFCSTNDRNVGAIDVKEAKEVILKALNVPRDVFTWQQNQMEVLEKYFYGCELLFECKKSAISVNAVVWRNIVNDLILFK
ncbi:MAG: NACHT domain-containing protein [Negativicutes bacterium]|nr:NACHT domain-containing protein [Negativicutes bacterium]